MLTSELRASIDKKWEACWPVSQVKPLAFLDMLSYLLFMKKIEEMQLVSEGWPALSSNDLMYTKEQGWSSFKSMDTKTMHKFLTEKNCVPGFIEHYSHANQKYSPFVKEPLLLAPTPGLLANTMEIIKVMEAEDNRTMAAIYEYLMHKVEIAGQNGQVYAPGYVVKLIVCMMQPSAEDVVWDPCAGNCSFLVNSAMYVSSNNSVVNNNSKRDFSADKFKGTEHDLIQLRIGAMNMILHGIENPELRPVNIFNKNGISVPEQPTLILSNLFFKNLENDMAVGAGTAKTDVTISREVHFLNLILKKLNVGARAAVIIPEIILYDNRTAIKTIREKIIDEHRLEAVISLPIKPALLFSGAAILIFSKPESGFTDEVWFYKMKQGIKIKNINSIKTGKNDALNFTEEYDDVLDILSRWKTFEKEAGKSRTDKSFYVKAGYIKENNYNLLFSAYKKAAEPERNINLKVVENEIADIKPPGDVPFGGVKKKPILISLMILCIGAVAFYFLSFKNINKNDNILPKLEVEDTSSPPSLPAVILPPSKPVKKAMKDTTAVPSQKQHTDLSARIKDSIKLTHRYTDAGTLQSNATIINTRPDIEKKTKQQYTVISTAYFHDQPNESTRRRAFINHWNKAVLNPIDERNGFIYIVYTNHLGQTSKGWLNKRDLRPL